MVKIQVNSQGKAYFTSGNKVLLAGGGSSITATNITGATVNEGDKVYIAANTNLKLINYEAFTSFGYTGIASETIANNASGKVAAYIKPPHSGLDQWDRVDNKATVVGFFTDGNGTKYAVCVADAQYRTGGQQWSTSTVDTRLPNYGSSSAALASTESAIFNMDTIRGNYDLSTYPAFNSAYSNTITFDGVTYNGLLPNAAELQMIYTNRENLDTLDTSLTDYPNNSLVTWNIGGNSGSRCWSSNEYNGGNAWAMSGGSFSNMSKNYVRCGIIPIFEIPIP